MIDVHNAFIYQAEAIANGEVWRLFTGQLLHINLQHFLYNAVALLLLWLIAKNIQYQHFWRYVVYCWLITGVGLFLFLTQVQWYLGASGFLHGVAFMVIANYIKTYRTLGVIALSVLVVKLIYEQTLGAIGVFDFEVIVDAHLIGFIAGVLVFFYKENYGKLQK
ncbi:Membrane protein, Rhomboid family [uncultured Candidatus Thioglobus sp.]|nr:Membrane protein, Rhomboid family [uncultured Candidatus Thioglobus sp.]